MTEDGSSKTVARTSHFNSSKFAKKRVIAEDNSHQSPEENRFDTNEYKISLWRIVFIYSVKSVPGSLDI